MSSMSPGIISFAENRISPINQTATQKRFQRASLHSMRLNLHAQDVDESRHQVDGLNEAIIARPARNLSSRVRIVDNPRYPRRCLMEQLLFAEPVIAQIVSMVAGEDEHCIVHAALCF